LAAIDEMSRGPAIAARHADLSPHVSPRGCGQAASCCPTRDSLAHRADLAFSNKRLEREGLSDDNKDSESERDLGGVVRM